MELFGKESMKKFIDKRKEITNPTNTSETIKEGRPNQNMPPIAPKQYQQVHANQTIMEHETNHSSDDDTESEDGDRDTLIQAFKVLKGLSTDRQANVVHCINNSTTLANTMSYKRLIFDTGADTSVVGKGWYVTHVYGPPISLVGFDSVHARKRNLRICTAETIIEHPQDGKFLLRIHEAVHNPSAEDTLLSEF